MPVGYQSGLDLSSGGDYNYLAGLQSSYIEHFYRFIHCRDQHSRVSKISVNVRFTLGSFA